MSDRIRAPSISVQARRVQSEGAIFKFTLDHRSNPNTYHQLSWPVLFKQSNTPDGQAREAEAYIRLRDLGGTYVPRYYGEVRCRDASGCTYEGIAIAFLEGQTLWKYALSKAPSPIPKEQQDIIMRTVQDFANIISRYQVIHNDISVLNVMMCSDNKIRFIDFGDWAEPVPASKWIESDVPQAQFENTNDALEMFKTELLWLTKEEFNVRHFPVLRTTTVYTEDFGLTWKTRILEFNNSNINKQSEEELPGRIVTDN